MTSVEKWRIKGFHGWLRRWKTFASGSEDFCRGIMGTYEHTSPPVPYTELKLVPPRSKK